MELFDNAQMLGLTTVTPLSAEATSTLILAFDSLLEKLKITVCVLPLVTLIADLLKDNVPLGLAGELFPLPLPLLLQPLIIPKTINRITPVM